jgi:hypothetical protein
MPAPPPLSDPAIDKTRQYRQRTEEAGAFMGSIIGIAQKSGPM